MIRRKHDISRSSGVFSPDSRARKNWRSNLHRPVFVEESSQHDLAREAAIRRRTQIDYGIVRELRGLPGVGGIVGFAESETAVDHNVATGIEWVGIDEDRSMCGGSEPF